MGGSQSPTPVLSQLENTARRRSKRWASGHPSPLAPAENVRATLLLVSRGEAPLGIVYPTDAAADKAVNIVGVFPAGTHPPIIYPIAVVATSTNPGAAGYVACLRSPAARPIFEKQGF